MTNSQKQLVPGTDRVLAVTCGDGSIFYGFEGTEPGWLVSAKLPQLTPSELRAIAEHKEALLKAGFKNFS